MVVMHILGFVCPEHRDTRSTIASTTICVSACSNTFCHWQPRCAWFTPTRPSILGVCTKYLCQQHRNRTRSAFCPSSSCARGAQRRRLHLWGACDPGCAVQVEYSRERHGGGATSTATSFQLHARRRHTCSCTMTTPAASTSTQEPPV